MHIIFYLIITNCAVYLIFYNYLLTRNIRFISKFVNAIIFVMSQSVDVSKKILGKEINRNDLIFAQ